MSRENLSIFHADAPRRSKNFSSTCLDFKHDSELFGNMRIKKIFWQVKQKNLRTSQTSLDAYAEKKLARMYYVASNTCTNVGIKWAPIGTVCIPTWTKMRCKKSDDCRTQNLPRHAHHRSKNLLASCTKSVTCAQNTVTHKCTDHANSIRLSMPQNRTKRGQVRPKIGLSESFLAVAFTILRFADHRSSAIYSTYTYTPFSG